MWARESEKCLAPLGGIDPRRWEGGILRSGYSDVWELINVGWRGLWERYLNENGSGNRATYRHPRPGPVRDSIAKLRISGRIIKSALKKE